MSARLPCPPAPGPLEAFAVQFDPLFHTLAQRQGFRTYLAGLLMPRDRCWSALNRWSRRRQPRYSGCNTSVRSDLGCGGDHRATPVAADAGRRQCAICQRRAGD